MSASAAATIPVFSVITCRARFSELGVISGFDCDFGPIADPNQLALQLQARAGIIEHGLFLDLTHAVIVSGPAGRRALTRT